MVLTQKYRHTDQNKIQNSLNKIAQKKTQAYMVNLSMTKESRIYNGEKAVSSTNGAGKTRQTHTRKKLDHFLKWHTKIKIGWTPKVRSETIKLIKKNIGSMFCTLILATYLWMSPEARKTKAKTNYWDYTSIKMFYTAKENINKTKSQPTSRRRCLKIISQIRG